jgi:hypothetical protein
MNSSDDHDRPERHFTLRVQPECAQHPWHAMLENERHGTVEFSSPLVLARFLANLNVKEPEDVRAMKGLR